MSHNNFQLCQMTNFDCTKWQYVNEVFLITKMGISCKLHMNGQRMRLYMLTIYIIHVQCADIMMSYHLWLEVECNFNMQLMDF